MGTLTAIAVARLLAAPVGRWLSVASLPVLLGLGLGKLTMVLGGAGQGNYSDSSWATSYAGSGPWGSSNPSYPALPSQILEGGLVLAVALGILLVPFLLRLRVRRWWRVVRLGLVPRREWSALTGGRRYMTALGMWALARFAAAFTWRDDRVLGPFGADQLLLVLVAAVALVGQPAPGAIRRMRAAWVALRAARREDSVRKAAQATSAAAAAEAAGTAEGPAAGQTLGESTDEPAAGTLPVQAGESEAVPDHTA